MALEWNSHAENSQSNFQEITLTVSKSTLKTAERKTRAYNYKSTEEVIQKAIGNGIDSVI